MCEGSQAVLRAPVRILSNIWLASGPRAVGLIGARGTWTTLVVLRGPCGTLRWRHLGYSVSVYKAST